MKINKEYINSFSDQINSTSRNDLKNFLTSGREIRHQSQKETHFWDLEQKELHQTFDQLYSKGIEKLAQFPSSPPLIGRISPLPPPAEAAKIGLGAFAGWFVGWVYTNSMTNLALHEYGHAWAINQVYNGAHPVVSSNALYWLFKGEWLKWLFGERDGAPGNWTAIDNKNAPLTPFGQSLSETGRNLFINFAGMGTELVFNTLIAGFGLFAIRKKQRALGASMLAFAAVSHSAAHSYIRRYPQFLNQDIPNNITVTDPIAIARCLSSLLHCSTMDAFRILWFGYLLAPIALIGLLALVILRSPSEIPDECVLMRLLCENPSFEIKKILAEVEVEIGSPHEIQLLDPKNQETQIAKITKILLKKIKSTPETHSLFEKTRSEMKGKFAPSLTNRLAIAALIVGLVASQALSLLNPTIPLIGQLLHGLSQAFIILQGIATLFDLHKTLSDLRNDALSPQQKALSIARTLLNITAFVLITAALFTPGLNGILTLIIIVCAILRLALFALHLYITRELSQTPAHN